MWHRLHLSCIMITTHGCRNLLQTHRHTLPPAASRHWHTASPVHVWVGPLPRIQWFVCNSRFAKHFFVSFCWSIGRARDPMSDHCKRWQAPSWQLQARKQLIAWSCFVIASQLLAKMQKDSDKTERDTIMLQCYKINENSVHSIRLFHWSCVSNVSTVLYTT